MRCVLFEPDDQRAAELTTTLARARVLCDLAGFEGLADLGAALTGLQGVWPRYSAVLVGTLEDPGEAIRSIAEAAGPVPVLAIVDTADELAGACLKSAGAAAVLARPVAGEAIVSCIRTLRRRAMASQAAQASVSAGSLTVHLDGRDPEIAGEALRVSDRELSVLTLLARHMGEPVARESVSTALAGAHGERPMDRMADLYVAKLRQKLSAAMGGTTLISALPDGRFRLGEPLKTRGAVVPSTPTARSA